MFRIDITKPYSSVKQEWLASNPSPYTIHSGCTHPEVKQTVKLNRAGMKMYRWQCVWCLRSAGAIKKHEVDRDQPVYQWDEEGYQRIQESLRVDYDAWTKSLNAVFWDYYHQYMESSAWRNRRAMVIFANSNKCQACGSASISHVHHRHYQTLGEEKVTDLAGLCLACHRAQHEHMWTTPPQEVAA